jgi:hypothetical protein
VKKQILKIKYEINTNLPSARAHHFKSDGQSFLRCDYRLASHLGEVDVDALSTLRHILFVFFLFVCVVSGISGWGCGSPHIPLPS